MPILLLGCATKASDVPVEPAIILNVPATNPCKFIKLQVYSKAFNQALANEVANGENLNENTAIRDYTRLRDAVRACQNSKG